MKNITLTFIISTIILMFGVTANAQNDWTFVRFETTVTRDGVETSDANPTERRFYISNIVQSPGNLRSYQLPKIIDEYFTANVVEPFKAKGITHQYYDSDVDMDCGSVLGAKDKADAEEKLAKCIEDTKEQDRITIYTFNWTFGDARGLETTQPTLIFRSKDSPNYQPKGGKFICDDPQPLAPMITTINAKQSKKSTKLKKP